MASRARAFLRAIDYQTGKIVWNHPIGDGAGTAGVLTTETGVTFSGDVSGNVMALRTSDGTTLWHAELSGRLEMARSLMSWTANSIWWWAEAARCTRLPCPKQMWGGPGGPPHQARASAGKVGSSIALTISANQREEQSAYSVPHDLNADADQDERRQAD